MKGTEDYSPIDPPYPVRGPPSSEASKDTAKVVHRNDAALMNSVGDMAIWQADADLADVARGGVHASHNTLVISFEKDADQGEGLDGDIELAWRQPLPESGVAHGGGGRSRSLLVEMSVKIRVCRAWRSVAAYVSRRHRTVRPSDKG